MENTSLIWKIVTIVLGVLVLVVAIILLIMGLKLANYNKAKASEISKKLSEQEITLKKQCQVEKEVTEETYTADDIFGFFVFKYPKVWYSNVTKEVGDGEELLFLANPALIVRDTDNPPIVALRVIVYNEKYATKVKDFDRYTGTEFTLSGMKGVKMSGYNEDLKANVTFALLPLRDKTIYIGTDDYPTNKDTYEKILQSFVLNK